MAGYSGTPLAKKLGIKDTHAVGLINEPDGFRASLEPLPPDVKLATGVRSRRDVVVAFFVARSELEQKLAAMTKAIFPDGSIWVAWPKKAAKVPTDITEDVVRAVALPTGLVDNKVCAIDDTWSGLRLVVRLKNRG
ncbi:MAG TPA: DUF3052 domain-containing protein [Acidimicrobiales bacterium]|jgi:hypothetical protein|nr:DUF3052 domain-containing protein [Acidimicrobiales bacterium]